MPKGAMRSVDASRFAMVPRSDIPRSAFDVAHTHKTTLSAGYLVPLYIDEVLPGDSLRLKMHAFARGSTPLVPIMDNIILESFFFFVPMRLVWSNWERFMGEMASPTDTTEFIIPQVVFPEAVFLQPSTLPDYMGIVTMVAASSVSVSALPFRAYNLIWNEFFRDQDIQAPIPVPVDDGPDPEGNYIIRRRNKRPDYFTTARPWPFKPLPNATVLNSFDQLVYQGNFQRPASGAPVVGLAIAAGSTATGGALVGGKESGARIVDYASTFVNSASNYRIRNLPLAGVDYPDLRVMVNDIRISSTVQAYLEKAARGGSRYTELMRTMFGVISPDARLQRPEYLGGGRSFVNIAPVTQTSPTGIAGTTTAMGEQAGTAVVSVYNHGFSQSFTEHGYIIGLVNLRADLTYQQGTQRLFHRRTMFDFYSPPFAHLGEQAIQRKELYQNGTAADDNTIFGYQERWSEYKYKPSRTSGFFRSSVATPLDVWHLAQEFGAAPVLNGNFIEENPPVERVMLVADNWGQAFLMDSLFEARWTRAMPMYSIPGLGTRL